MRVGIVFEYPTVNGGENSMFAVIEWLLADARSNDLELVALGPPRGAVWDRLSALNIETVAFDRHTTEEEAQGKHRVAGVECSEPPAGGKKLGARCTRPQPPRQSHTAEQEERPPQPSRELQIESLITAVEAARPDILHANSLAMGRLLGAAASQLSCPTTAHLRDILKLSKAAIRDLNQNSQLVAVSKATREFHIAQGLTVENSCVVHNGIMAPVRSEQPSATREQVRAELGIPADANVLLTVGQIGLRKGLDTLAEAARRLPAGAQPLHWLIAGERFSRKQESIDFERQVFETFQSATPVVMAHRLGYRNDVAELMLASDLLVHGARQEPLGRVLLEAASLQLPIVATDVGGTREILKDGVSGLLVPADDPAATASAIERLLSDADLRVRLAGAAAEKVARDFSVERSARRLVTLWRSVDKEKKSRPEA
jgi:glycosyltransferase involved in cell wall biosynthesis